MTLAELLHGVEKSQQKGHNLKQLEDFISRLIVLDYDSKAAPHYSEIRTDLELEGNIVRARSL